MRNCALGPGDPVRRGFSIQSQSSLEYWITAFAGDDGYDWRGVLPSLNNRNAYAFSVSRNRTGSPVDGVVTSPCHITHLPRTKVPTGQPVTRTPS
jgi:hypothetical protein